MSGARSQTNAVRTGAAIVVLVCGTLMFLFFGLFGVVAWSDYSDRGCPGSVQCEDAVAVMWIAGLVSLASVALVTLCLRLLFRGRLKGRGDAVAKPK